MRRRIRRLSEKNWKRLAVVGGTLAVVGLAVYFVRPPVPKTKPPSASAQPAEVNRVQNQLQQSLETSQTNVEIQERLQKSQNEVAQLSSALEQAMKRHDEQNLTLQYMTHDRDNHRSQYLEELVKSRALQAALNREKEKMRLQHAEIQSLTKELEAAKADLERAGKWDQERTKRLAEKAHLMTTLREREEEIRNIQSQLDAAITHGKGLERQIRLMVSTQAGLARDLESARASNPSRNQHDLRGRPVAPSRRS